MEERVYDLIFICRPATPEEEIGKIITTLETSATELGGKIEKTEKWGTRRLAYRVAKHREGFFVYMVVRSSNGDIIKELERRWSLARPAENEETFAVLRHAIGQAASAPLSVFSIFPAAEVSRVVIILPISSSDAVKIKSYTRSSIRLFNSVSQTS